MKKLLITSAAILATATMSADADIKKIDEFNGSVNLVGGRQNCYQSAPSRAMSSIEQEEASAENPNRVLRIRFDKANEGGKFGKGGWCGWYTLFYHPQSENPKFLDVHGKGTITFRVKGEQGGENFRVNVKDRDREIADAPPPAIDIGSFLPKGKVTKDWQKVSIPLDTFNVDPSSLASFSINFEHDCYPEGKSSGTIFVDDLAFE